MNAKSIKGKTTEEIQSALQQSRADGFKPTLAIIFSSISQDRKAITKIFDDTGIKIFGATTNGEFTDENPEKLSIAVLLMDMNPAHFSILTAEYPQKNYREIAREVASKAKQLYQHPAFLISGTHLETDAEQILFGFEDEIGKDVNVFGGMAGDDYAFKEQFVFSNNYTSSIGMVALVLDEDKIKIRGRATCGWNAVGTEKLVTKSEGNHVYTVDNIPVLDLTTKYGGLENVTPGN